MINQLLLPELREAIALEDMKSLASFCEILHPSIIADMIHDLGDPSFYDRAFRHVDAEHRAIKRDGIEGIFAPQWRYRHAGPIHRATGPTVRSASPIGLIDIGRAGILLPELASPLKSNQANVPAACFLLMWCLRIFP